MHDINLKAFCLGREAREQAKREVRASVGNDRAICGALIPSAQPLPDVKPSQQRSPEQRTGQTCRHGSRPLPPGSRGTSLWVHGTEGHGRQAARYPSCSSCSDAFHFYGSRQAGSIHPRKSTQGAERRTASRRWPAKKWKGVYAMVRLKHS